MTTDEEAITAAIADGWELDNSPETEMLNENWYRRDPASPRIREETLIERYLK